MTIKFTACLQGSACLKFDDDGSSTVKLTVSSNELHNAVKMVTMKGRSFLVTIGDDYAEEAAPESEESHYPTRPNRRKKNTLPVSGQ